MSLLCVFEASLDSASSRSQSAALQTIPSQDAEVTNEVRDNAYIPWEGLLAPTAQ